MNSTNKTLICFLIALTPCLSVFAQQTKTLTADKHNEYGLVYTLPITSLCIEVEAKRTVSVPGPYWQYAKKYIGTDKVVKENSEKWIITSVKVKRYGIPDSENRYMMQFKPGALTYISVGDDNMLFSINKEISYQTPDISDSETTLQSASDIKEYLQFVDEDFISSQSSAKQAQMLAQSLMEVRDAKVSLSRGTAETMPTDGRQLELMLQSLEKQEKALTAAFTGTTEESVIKRTYTFTPDQAGKTVLFRMSNFAGFVDADDYAGDPVYIEISGIENAELPVDAKGDEKKLPKDAVIYNIPGRANVKISFKGSTLWNEAGDYAQYGIQFGLAPNLFSDKKARSYAVFDTSTGALREIGEMSNGE